MLGLVTVCRRPDRSMEEVFNEFMDKTMGDKIIEFKRVCDSYQFTERQRAILNEINTELDRLVQKRNWIVHGTTYQIGKNADDAQPYRIGKTRGDRGGLGCLNSFSACH
jgi:hypothetical protein